jgi:CRP-like cAMP-binding protein
MKQPLGGATLNETRNSPDNDLDILSRLKAFSWLDASELKLLAGALAIANFKKPQVIFAQTALASEAHILLRGIARITCQNARSKRVTIAMLAPGPIPDFPSPPLSQFDFRCVAYNDCRVGSLGWNDFNRITAHGSESAFQKFHASDLQQWYRLLLRSSGFLNLDLHERVALTLLELCSDFGIEESRGTLLRVTFSHKDIAELVGASRPRVSEQLAQLERDQFVLRDGRRLFVQVAKLSDSMTLHAAGPVRSNVNERSEDARSASA